jgi:DNA-binding CsgD family transcriptional regulator
MTIFTLSLREADHQWSDARHRIVADWPKKIRIREQRMDDLSRYVLGLYDSAQCCGINEFIEVAFEGLARYIGFERGAKLSHIVCDDGELAMSAMYPYRLDARRYHAQRAKWLKTERLAAQRRLQSPDLLLARAIGELDACHSLAMDAVQDHAMRHFAAALGYSHCMMLASARPASMQFESIALWRSEADHPFGDTDRKAGNRVFPHLIKAFEINNKLNLSRQVDYGKDGQANIICSAEGFVHAIDDAGRALIEAEWPNSTLTFMPKALLDALRNSGGMQYFGRRLVARAELYKDSLVIQLKPVVGGDTLTPTELRVAQLVTEGGTYKEIARTLGTAPSTVRNQIHSIYVKLGVSRRNDLVSALAILEQ